MYSLQKTAIMTNVSDINSVQFLSDFLEEGFNHKAKIKNKGKGIHLILLPNDDQNLGKEGYRLKVDQQNITIEAAADAGFFYGLQTS